MIRTHKILTTARQGFSRIDLLVVLSLAILLGVLIAPGILSAQQKARAQDCLSNIRTVGLAFQNYASAKQGQLAPLSTAMTVRNSAGQDGEIVVGWPIVLLPAMNSADVFKNLSQSVTVDKGTAQIAEDQKVPLPFLTCPNDPEAQGKAGRLSYIVNAGFISRDLYGGDPDRKHRPGSLSWDDNDTTGEPKDVAVHSATGVTWIASDKFQPSLDFISTGDGSTTTLLLAENLQAGHWFDTDTARIGLVVPVANTKGRVPFGNGATFESKISALNADFAGGTLATAKPHDWQINQDPKAKLGTRPRPSSNHVGFVHIVMCDGATRRLSQKVDPQVYVKMITANGVTYGERLLIPSAYEGK